MCSDDWWLYYLPHRCHRKKHRRLGLGASFPWHGLWSHLFENAVTSSGRLSWCPCCVYSTEGFGPSAIWKQFPNRKANLTSGINMGKMEREFTAAKRTSFPVGVEVDQRRRQRFEKGHGLSSLLMLLCVDASHEPQQKILRVNPILSMRMVKWITPCFYRCW